MREIEDSHQKEKRQGQEALQRGVQGIHDPSTEEQGKHTSLQAGDSRKYPSPTSFTF